MAEVTLAALALAGQRSPRACGDQHLKGVGHHCASTALLFSLQRGEGSEEADDERGA